MDLVSAIVNIIYFLLVLYLISWFARKINKIEERLIRLEKNLNLFPTKTKMEKSNGVFFSPKE
ncbi:hypothetical protein J27TS8_03530 [Robertmurraya siralis]|uniref:Uncharacterized protein n=1 Tax=Robertmurraya siralis TaxID=77777 RepID=A0A919WEA3_9BACI|nr:hypothetical protein J27TS8_03530 [Robertmurraya siralis]